MYLNFLKIDFIIVSSIPVSLVLYCFDCADAGRLTGISLHLEQRIELPT